MIEKLYMGVRQDGTWSAQLITDMSDDDLAELDLMRLHTALLPSRLTPQEAASIIARLDAVGSDPFLAIWLQGHESRGLEVLRERLHRVRHAD